MSVFGVYGTPHAAQVIYYGLHAIQHRGQEGAGIVTFNGDGEGHRLSGKGLISEIFNKDNLATLTGNMGLAMFATPVPEKDFVRLAMPV